jgi:ubiquitin C-terminal hydrolase
MEQAIQCELRGEDLNGMFYNKVNVKGINGKWARKNKVESGVTTLFAENSIIDDTLSELEIPLGQTIQVRNMDVIMTHRFALFKVSMRKV